MSNIIVLCPSCDSYVEILEINCAIFRHGVLKQTNIQIPPHASKNECDNYIENDLIYGCGKPFKIEKKDEEYIAVLCDYI